MGEVSRRRFIQVVGTSALIGGCVTPSLNDLVDVFIEDVGLPSPSDYPYALKLYEHSDNNLNDPEIMLGDPDFNHAEFLASRRDPLEFVVGFAREFPSHVLISGYWDDRLDVEGYAASAVSLAGLGDTRRFVSNSSRGEEGFAQSRPRDGFGFGGEVQIDTGPGSERYFKFKAYPQAGEIVIGIDYLKASG